MARLMGLDLGEKRVGVALSDESETLATPYEVVQRVSFARLLDRLEQIVAREHVRALVIGHPLSLSGDVGPQARHLAAEAERIAERLGLPLTLWDERLTTVSAEQLLAERGTRNGRRKRTVDAMVAAIILQEYLDTQNTMKAPNTVEEDFNANG